MGPPTHFTDLLNLEHTLHLKINLNMKQTHSPFTKLNLPFHMFCFPYPDLGNSGRHFYFFHGQLQVAGLIHFDVFITIKVGI